MELKDSGTIQVDGYNVRRTDDNRWLITKAGTMISYVDTLAEVYPAIDYHVARVRARAAKAHADAAEAKEKASWGETLLHFTDQEANDVGDEVRAKLEQTSTGLHLGNGNILSY